VFPVGVIRSGGNVFPLQLPQRWRFRAEIVKLNRGFVNVWDYDFVRGAILAASALSSK
jgi:hypothetical protein